MGMNVNLGTGVNSYSANALPSTAPKYTSQVQSSLLSQPAYDTVSFSGRAQQLETQEKQGLSTGAKVGIVAAAATAVIGIWAASRGKKINTANGETAKLVNNIKTGLKSIFTKAGRESYSKIVADKADDVVKATTEAGKKAATTTQQQGATKFTQETMDAAGANAKKAQKDLTKLNEQLEAAKKAGDSEKIQQLQKKITEQEKTINKFVNLTTSENLANDKAYTKLKDTKVKAQEALDTATKKKEALETSKEKLEAKKNDLLASIGKKKQTEAQKKMLQSYTDDIAKKEKQIQAIINGTKDKNGKVLTKPLATLETEWQNTLTATKQYKQAAKTLSEAQITATNNTQFYQQILEQKNNTLTPSKNLLDRVDALKVQANDSNTTLNKLKKAWEAFAQNGTYDANIFGKI